MDVKKVVIIYEEDKYDEDIILDELKSEGFKYYFKIANKLELAEVSDFLETANEVWTFGEVSNTVAYRMAKFLGKDFWVMA